MVNKNPDRPYGKERDAERDPDAAGSLSSFLAALEGVRLSLGSGRQADGLAGAMETAGTEGMQSAGLDFSLGSLVVPTRAVLRVVLRGRKARTIDSFARAAIHFNRG